MVTFSGRVMAVERARVGGGTKATRKLADENMDFAMGCEIVEKCRPSGRGMGTKKICVDVLLQVVEDEWERVRAAHEICG